jgi:hypothetical protein
MFQVLLHTKKQNTWLTLKLQAREPYLLNVPHTLHIIYQKTVVCSVKYTSDNTQCLAELCCNESSTVTNLWRISKSMVSFACFSSQKRKWCISVIQFLAVLIPVMFILSPLCKMVELYWEPILVELFLFWYWYFTTCTSFLMRISYCSIYKRNIFFTTDFLDKKSIVCPI